jgi:hypothetical protein
MMEHDYEPVRGLPGHLPTGERILWQGSPEWWPIARHAMHVRGIAIYFMLIMAWSGYVVTRESGVISGIVAAAWVAPVALAAIAIVSALAWGMARTTVYTVTDKRVVMRFGIALPIAVNVPYAKVDGIAMHADADGTGNLAFDIGDKPNIGYFTMWPHARPLWWSRTQPMLRGVHDPQKVADIVRDAISRTIEVPVGAAATADFTTVTTESIATDIAPALSIRTRAGTSAEASA